jgi:hypothetical protein
MLLDHSEVFLKAPAVIEIQLQLFSNYLVEISRIYFSQSKPSGVSDRMYSVDYDRSTAGEYETIEEHSSKRLL